MNREALLQLQAHARAIDILVTAALGDLPPHAGETPEQVVARLYQEVFGREPDSGGLAYWAGRLRSGMTEAELRAALRGYIPQPPPPPAPRVGFTFAGPGNWILRRLEAGVPYAFAVPFEGFTFQLWPQRGGTFHAHVEGPATYQGIVLEKLLLEYPRQAGAVFVVTVDEAGDYQAQAN